MSSKKRDPRMETDPPSDRERDSEREPTAKVRRATARELHAFAAPPPAIRSKDPHARMGELESELTRERAERAAEADLMGQILARATQAEARVKILEQALARVNEERTLAESQLQTVRAELDKLLASNGDAYAQQTASLQSRHDDTPQLRAARSLVLELLQVLDGVLTQGTISDLPMPPSSKKTSDRPRTPTARPNRLRP